MIQLLTAQEAKRISAQVLAKNKRDEQLALEEKDKQDKLRAERLWLEESIRIHEIISIRAKKGASEHVEIMNNHHMKDLVSKYFKKSGFNTFWTSNGIKITW